MIKKLNYLTSKEVADTVGFSHEHVRKLLQQGKIKGEKLGRNWIVEKKQLSKIKRQRFPRLKE
jgi:excisionase family DNA binding protein